MKVLDGASGSSTMSAKERTSARLPLQMSAGDSSPPLQEYWAGIAVPEAKAGLVSTSVESAARSAAGDIPSIVATSAAHLKVGIGIMRFRISRIRSLTVMLLSAVE